MKIFNKFINWINNIFSIKCPKCDNKMDILYLNMKYDSLVYRCEKCKKNYI